MASNLTTFAAFLKQYYNPGQVTALTIKNRVFYAKVKKSLSSGTPWCTPVIFANGQAGSSTLANAQTVATGVSGNLKGLQWQSLFGDYNYVVDIGDKVIAASRDNVGAFFSNKTAEIDRAYEGFADVMGAYFLGAPGHSVTPGSFDYNAGTFTGTLQQPDDGVFLYVGMALQVSIASGDNPADVLLAGQGTGFITNINRNTGVFLVSGTTAAGVPSNPTNWTTRNYFAFRLGDFGAVPLSAGSSQRIVLGLSAWVPAADPSATVFENVDRTVDLTALSGVRLTAAEIAGQNNEQRLKRLVARMCGRAAAPPPTDIFCHPEKWQDIVETLESRGVRTLGEKVAGFNFQKIEMATSGGMVSVWSDRFCPFNAAFAVNFDYIEAKSYTGFPSTINQDGTDLLRLSSSNDYEYRLTCYPAFQVKAPGFQGRVAMA